METPPHGSHGGQCPLYILINEIASLLAFHFSFPSSCLGTQILPQALLGDIFVSPTTNWYCVISFAKKELGKAGGSQAGAWEPGFKM